MDTNECARRLAWLCAELQAGNAFSRETLERWRIEAEREDRNRCIPARLIPRYG